jgi:hypothetical protein
MWLFVTPLLHFLNGDCKPFESLNIAVDHRDPKWWGVQDLNDVKEKSKKMSVK